MEPVDCVKVEAEPKREEKEEIESKSDTIIALDMMMMTTTLTSTDPWMLFLYALKAPATRDKYIQRLLPTKKPLLFSLAYLFPVEAIFISARGVGVYLF